MRIVVLAALLLLTAHSRAQQPTPPASVEGIVVRFGTNEPIPGVSVELSKAGLTAIAALSSPPATDLTTVTATDAGTFAFQGVVPGDYRIIAHHAGGTYANAEYGQRAPGARGLTMTVGAGQRVTNVKLEMAVTGSISGRVFDGDGEAVGNARVMALQPVYRNGRRALNIVQAVRANDLGEYRLYWLMPGTYYIAVMPQDLRSPSFAVYIAPPGRSGNREDASSPVITRRSLEDGRTIEETWTLVYYGGGANMERALPIEVRSGANVGAVDVAVGDAKVRSHRARGVVIDGSTGQPAATAIVRAVPRTTGPHILIPNGTTDKSGAFDLGGLVPDSYFLVAAVTPSLGGGQGETFFDVAGGPVGVIPIEIQNSDLDNLSVAIRPAFTLQGRITGDTDLTKIRISLTRDPALLGLPNRAEMGAPIPTQAGPTLLQPNPASGIPSQDGTFSVRGFGPGDYRVRVSLLPPDAYVKSISLGNADVLSGGLSVDSTAGERLEIVLGTNGASLEGIVVNSRREPVGNGTVIVVPDIGLRHRQDLYKVAPTNAAGRFSFRGLPPGDYDILAFEVIEPDAWHDPAFLRTYEGRGQRLHLDEGAKNQLSLTVIP
jgi:hypothetical protein